MGKNRRTITILGLMLCVVAVLVGRQIGRRMQNKLDALDSEISTCQSDKDRANREIQVKTHYVEKWDRIKGLLQKTVQERRLNFDAHLIKLADDSGVVIRQKDYSDLPMKDLKVDCKIGELADFIALLDQEKDWLLRIENLIVNTADRSSFGARTFETELPSTKDIQVDMVVSIPTASSEEETTKPKGLSKGTL